MAQPFDDEATSCSAPRGTHSDEHRNTLRPDGVGKSWRVEHGTRVTTVRHAACSLADRQYPWSFGPATRSWKGPGQSRPYVRPVARLLPLAIMGVRPRVIRFPADVF